MSSWCGPSYFESPQLGLEYIIYLCVYMFMLVSCDGPGYALHLMCRVELAFAIRGTTNRCVSHKINNATNPQCDSHITHTHVVHTRWIHPSASNNRIQIAATNINRRTQHILVCIVCEGARCGSCRFQGEENKLERRVLTRKIRTFTEIDKFHTPLNLYAHHFPARNLRKSTF